MAVALRVLLVEDEPNHAAAIRAELARGDYALTCECVSTPAAFAQALQQGGWSVILCDFLLPGFNGNDALALAKQASSTAPFIIVSGQLDADAAVAAMRAGATDYVRKANLPSLRPRLERALREAEELRTQERLRQETAARARQQAALAEFGPWALAGMPLDALLAGTAERVAEALSVEFCEILELIPGEEAMLLRAGCGWQPGCVGHIRISASAESQAGATWQHNAPMTVNDWAATKDLQPSALLREHRVQSGLTVPIRLRDRLFGVLGAHTARPREFNAADAHFLQAFANVLATAIERKLAEDALRESDERFRLLVEEVKGFAILTLDPEACVQTWNHGAEHLFGYPAAEMIGQHVARLYPPGDVELGKPELDLRLAEEMGQFEDEDWRQQAGGTQFWANVVITALRRADGTLRGYGIVTRDMTERRQAHEALRLNEEKFRSLVNHIPDAVWTMNAAGDALFLSGNAERIYGCPAAELKAPGAALGLGRVPADDVPRLRAAWQALFEQQQRFEIECRYQRKDGQTAWLLLRASAIYEKDGQLVADGITSDITEKKKLEHQFLRAQRMESIGTLAGGVAHDLNNILSPIMMSAPLLRMDELPADDFDRLVDTIETNAQRGSDIVRQLLAFGRGLEGERVVVQPRHIIKEMVKIARETFPKNLTVTADLPEQLWPIIGDPTHLHQVLLNLCINARDAMPGGGTLKITAENVLLDEHYVAQNPEAKAGPFLCLRVSDTGTGIPKAILDKIFEPFFTTKEAGKGTGLGLATVMGIVKSHAGLIQVQSEIGKGSTFSVMLPAAPNATAVAEETSREPLPAGHGETILLVDDEPGILAATRKLLERHNYQVLIATDGAEALTLFTRQRASIALVITDVMMPVMDGVALTRVIRKLAPDARVIASSGLERDGRFEELRALGVTTVLTKPYPAEKLLRALRELLPAQK